MSKKLTGLKFTPQDFRELQECVRCGKASSIGYGESCELCKLLDLQKCEMCEVLLREGTHRFYTYDIKEDHRENGTDFKANKEEIREFYYDKVYPKHNGILCNACENWEKDLKHWCYMCNTPFRNTKNNYMLNGNACENCTQERVPTLAELQEELIT